MSTWTQIAATRYDADSDMLVALITDIRQNIEYDHDRACRCGTHALGKRLAVARGQAQLTFSSAGDTSQGVQVVFASDAIDGDPNFSATPESIVLQLVEFGSNWTSQGAMWPQVNFSTGLFGGGSQPPSRTSFWICVERRNGFGSNFTVKVNWRATGLASAGE